MLERDTIILHLSINFPLMCQPFTPSREVVIDVVISVVLTTAITLVTTVLIFHDYLYSLQSRIWYK